MLKCPITTLNYGSFLKLVSAVPNQKINKPTVHSSRRPKVSSHFWGWELQLSYEGGSAREGTNSDLWQRTGIALEFSFSISKTRAAHHLATFSLTVPLLSNLVVHTIIMAPFWGVGKIRGKELLACSDSQDGERTGTCHQIFKARYLEGVARKDEGHDPSDKPLFWLDLKILSLPLNIFSDILRSSLFHHNRFTRIVSQWPSFEFSLLKFKIGKAENR